MCVCVKLGRDVDFLDWVLRRDFSETWLWDEPLEDEHLVLVDGTTGT